MTEKYDAWPLPTAAQKEKAEASLTDSGTPSAEAMAAIESLVQCSAHVNRKPNRQHSARLIDEAFAGVRRERDKALMDQATHRDKVAAIIAAAVEQRDKAMQAVEALRRERDELRRTTFVCTEHVYPYGVDPSGEGTAPICPWCERLDVARLEREREALREGLRDVFSLLDDNWLVRNIEHDAEPGFASRQLVPLRILAKARALLAGGGEE